MKLTDNQLAEWRRFVSHHAIVDSWLLFEHNDVEIIEACNGIGAASWPESARAILDSSLPTLLLPSVIHDLQWTFGNDGSREYFLYTNAVFTTNGRLMAKYHFPWWRPARYISLSLADRAGNLLDALGWPAYRKAYEESQRKISAST